MLGETIEKIMIFLAVFTICLFAFASPLFAFTVKGGNTVTISEDLDDDIYFAGNVANVAGDIGGDFFAGARIVNIFGTVKGDLLSAGASINVEGSIGDSARIIGKDIVITSNVAKDLIIIGGNIDIAKGAIIGGDLVVIGGTVKVSGDVIGDVIAFGGSVVLEGKTGKSAQINSSNITVDGGEIKGDLKYISVNPVKISSESKIFGKTIRDKFSISNITKLAASAEEKMTFKTFASGFFGSRLVKFGGFLILGIILILVLPWTFKKYSERMKKSFGANTGIGFVVLIIAPAAFIVMLAVSIMLFITKFGSALGGFILICFFFAVAVYILFILLGNVYFAYYIGSLVYQKLKIIKAGFWHKALFYITGLIILSLILAVPILGIIAGFAAALFGFGGLTMLLKDWALSYKRVKG